MQAPRSRPTLQPGDAMLAQSAGVAYASGLRDADWLPEFLPRSAEALCPRAQVLHRWSIPADAAVGGLDFLPLDGNPRHGVLSLFATDQQEIQAAIEILERQGRWMVMPESGRARMLAYSALARRCRAAASVVRQASTPDQRFVFFNARQDGGTVTLVERRQDAPPMPEAHAWPR